MNTEEILAFIDEEIGRLQEAKGFTFGRVNEVKTRPQTESSQRQDERRGRGENRRSSEG
jgi:hypothetical protein